MRKGVQKTVESLKIGIIASARHAIREPFAGGLEMHTHALATSLRRRGHDVTVFASATSDDALGMEPVCGEASGLDFSQAAQADVSMLAEPFMHEHHAYLHLMLRLQAADFDVVQNSSLHYLPVAMASALPCPFVTTLHTPPTPWLESALAARPAAGNATYVSVSVHNARAWKRVESCRVIPNGIDLGRWAFSPEADPTRAVWMGRIVREKGPHYAIEAAHAAGLSVTLAGPVHDEAYFRREVQPRLAEGDCYAGHLAHGALAALVGRAGVFLCTPCWDEPYGLVVAEALACGTPVAAFARGAVPEILDEASGRTAPPNDVRALAEAARACLTLSRRACRRRAEVHCSLQKMVDRYERLYRRLATADAPPPRAVQPPAA